MALAGLGVAVVEASALGAPRTSSEDQCAAPGPGLWGVPPGPELSALHRFEVGAFYESVEDRERRRALGSIRGHTPLTADDCPLSDASNGPRLSLVLRGTIGDSLDRFGRSRSAPVEMLGAYRRMYATNSSCDRSSRDFVECERAHGASDYARFGEDFGSTSPRDVVGSSRFWSASTLSSADVLLLQHYQASLNASSERDMLGILRRSSASLTTAQKVVLVQMYGEQFREGYDMARFDAGLSAPGVVTLGDLVGAARHNTTVRFRGDPSEPIGALAELSGVCRDIASAQAQIASALGFRNTYVITQAMLGGYHVGLLAQDPARPDLYHFSYENMNAPRAGDARALFAGPKDATIGYRVFQPAGRTVTTVQSELGKFLTEAAGFDPRTLDPLSQMHGAMLAADVALGTGSPTAMRYGLGADGIGARYVFAGLSQTYGDFGWLPGRVGLVLGSQIRPAYAFGPDDGRDVNVDLLYLQLEQRLRTPAVRLGSGVGARFESTVTAMIAGHRVRDGELAGEANLQGDLRFATGFRLDHARADIAGTYRVGVQISPGIADVRDNAAPQMPRPTLDHVLAAGEERIRLGVVAGRSTWLLAGATALMSELGVRGRAEAGLARGPIGATGSIEGRLRESDVLFLDGSGRRAGASLFWDITAVMRVHANVSAPIESLGPGSLGRIGTTGFGGLDVKY